MGQYLNSRVFHLNDGVNEIETFAIRQYIISISRDIRDGNIVITIIIAILDPEPQTINQITINIFLRWCSESIRYVVLAQNNSDTIGILTDTLEVIITNFPSLLR